MESPAARETPSGSRPYRPPDGRTLIGPLLTERAFARRLGTTPRAVRRDLCLPRIDSPIALEPAYPAFMLDEGGLRLDAAFIALLLRRRLDDLEACDWLTRRNPSLGDESPLRFMEIGGALDAVIDAFPPPTRAMPMPASRSEEVEEMRRQWLRYRGEEPSPGWKIAWDRAAVRRTAAPHGV